MDYWRCLWAMVGKDVRIEARSKASLMGMLVFALLIVVIFSFALDPSRETVAQVFPGAVWISFFFAGTLGLQRAMSGEETDGRLWSLMLAPVDRSVIFVAKCVTNAMLMFAVEIVSLPLFAAFMDYRPAGSLRYLILVMLLGTWGFVVIGTLLAGVAAGSRLSQLLLPIVMFPLLIPVVLGAVKLTAQVLAGAGLAEMAAWLRVLVAYDVLFTALAFVLFEEVLEA
jgi:heme exporter protein B